MDAVAPSVGAIVVITHSLASRPVFETVMQMTSTLGTDEQGKLLKDLGIRFSRGIRTIFTLANQLPILCLSDMTVDNVVKAPTILYEGLPEMV
jgi:hypothetical protein